MPLERTPQPVVAGQEIVTKTGMAGKVLAVKWSPESGWWIEYRTPEGIAYRVQEGGLA